MPCGDPAWYVPSVSEHQQAGREPDHSVRCPRTHSLAGFVPGTLAKPLAPERRPLAMPAGRGADSRKPDRTMRERELDRPMLWPGPLDNVGLDFCART